MWMYDPDGRRLVYNRTASGTTPITVSMAAVESDLGETRATLIAHHLPRAEPENLSGLPDDGLQQTLQSLADSYKSLGKAAHTAADTMQQSMQLPNGSSVLLSSSARTTEFVEDMKPVESSLSSDTFGRQPTSSDFSWMHPSFEDFFGEVSDRVEDLSIAEASFEASKKHRERIESLIEGYEPNSNRDFRDVLDERINAIHDERSSDAPDATRVLVRGNHR